MPGWVLPAIGLGLGALDLWGSSKKQGEANDLQRRALEYAERDYNQRMPLRRAFTQGSMTPIAQAPDFSFLTDTGNPFARGQGPLPHVGSQLNLSGLNLTDHPTALDNPAPRPPTGGGSVVPPGTTYTESGNTIKTEMGLNPGGMDSTVPGGPKKDLRMWEMANAELDPSTALPPIPAVVPRTPLGGGSALDTGLGTTTVGDPLERLSLNPTPGPTPIPPPVPSTPLPKTKLPATSTLDRRLAGLKLGGGV